MALQLTPPSSNLSDSEIVQFLLDEVVYGIEPELQETTSIGGVFQGIDNDPNFHVGYYSVNDKIYKISWQNGIVKIRKGYKIGRTLHEGPLDWPRLRKAIIMHEVYHKFGGKKALDATPDLRDNAYQTLLSQNRFRLSSEISNEDANSAPKSVNSP